MTLYNWLSILGVGGIFTAIYRLMWKALMKQKTDTDAVKLGIQALLRAQMINDYNHYLEKGYAPIYARENFENVWKQYEALGENGVMEDIHRKFLAMPTRKENDNG